MPSAPNLLLLIDWDGTITNSDTISLLAPTEQELLPNKKPFEYYQDAYLRNYEAFKKSFGEIDTPERLIEYIVEQGRAEYGPLRILADDGLFSGTTMEQRCQRIKNIEFRSGWKAMSEWMTDAADKKLIEAHIVSVNWSSRFIFDGLLYARGYDVGLPYGALCKLGWKSIQANELEWDEQTGKCTGQIVGPDNTDMMVSCTDKMKRVELLASSCTDSLHVYIGDAMTDWLCLQWADVGILMSPSESFLQTLERIGLNSLLCTPSEWLKLAAAERKMSVLLVQTWSEVQALLHTLLEELRTDTQIK